MNRTSTVRINIVGDESSEHVAKLFLAFTDSLDSKSSSASETTSVDSASVQSVLACHASLCIHGATQKWVLSDFSGSGSVIATLLLDWFEDLYITCFPLLSKVTLI